MAFANGDIVVARPFDLLPLTSQSADWTSVKAGDIHIEVLVDGQPTSISWLRIRELTDPRFAAYLDRSDREAPVRIGKKLADLRKRAGMSAKALAERVGIKPQNLSRIEHGRVETSGATIDRLLAAMGYTFADMRDDSNEPDDIRTVAEQIVESVQEATVPGYLSVPRTLIDELEAALAATR